MHCSAFIVTSILFKNDPGWSWALVGQRGGVPRPFPLALPGPTPASRVSASPPLVDQLHPLHLPPRDPRRAPQRRFGWDSRPSRPHTPRPLLTWLVGLVSRFLPIQRRRAIKNRVAEWIDDFLTLIIKCFFFWHFCNKRNRWKGVIWRMSKGLFKFLR